MITIKRLQMHVKDTFIFKEDDLVMVRLCLEIFYSSTCEKLQLRMWVHFNKVRLNSFQIR